MRNNSNGSGLVDVCSKSISDTESLSWTECGLQTECIDRRFDPIDFAERTTLFGGVQPVIATSERLRSTTEILTNRKDCMSGKSPHPALSPQSWSEGKTENPLAMRRAYNTLRRAPTTLGRGQAGDLHPQLSPSSLSGSGSERLGGHRRFARVFGDHTLSVQCFAACAKS